MYNKRDLPIAKINFDKSNEEKQTHKTLRRISPIKISKDRKIIGSHDLTNLLKSTYCNTFSISCTKLSLPTCLIRQEKHKCSIPNNRETKIR